jgi:hypothetical protein
MLFLIIAVFIAAVLAVATPRHTTGVSTSVTTKEFKGYDFSYHYGLSEHHKGGCPCSGVKSKRSMGRIVIVAIALVIGAFGFRTNNGSQPSETPATTTTVVVENNSFGAHDVLQQELNDPEAFPG